MIDKIRRWLERRKHRIGETRSVHITYSDIDAGQPGIATACAVAVAARRIFPDADRIVVSRMFVIVEQDGMIEEWRDTTGKLPLFTTFFDHYKSVEPFTLTVQRFSRKEDNSRVRTRPASAS